MHDKINVILDKLVSAIAFTIGSFHLLNVSGLFVLSTPDVRIFHLMMMMAILFMTKPTLKRLQGNFYDRITSLILVVAALASSVYLLTRWKDIAMSGGETVALDAWVGLLVLVLVLVILLQVLMLNPDIPLVKAMLEVQN